MAIFIKISNIEQTIETDSVEQTIDVGQKHGKWMESQTKRSMVNSSIVMSVVILEVVLLKEGLCLIKIF